MWWLYVQIMKMVHNYIVILGIALLSLAYRR
jgi:hypothetical protein